MIARNSIPLDPLERRRLWREWIHTDSPQVERVMPRRVECAASAEQNGRVEGDWLPEVIDAPAGVIHGLKRAITECLEGDRLPINDRERLIRRSMKLGLNRFEANLLIAAVQNRARENLAIDTTRFVSPRPARSRLVLAVVILLTMEVAGFFSLVKSLFFV